jgi:hypothetical protein
MSASDSGVWRAPPNGMVHNAEPSDRLPPPFSQQITVMHAYDGAGGMHNRDLVDIEVRQLCRRAGIGIGML